MFTCEKSTLNGQMYGVFQENTQTLFKNVAGNVTEGIFSSMYEAMEDISRQAVSRKAVDNYIYLRLDRLT